MNVCYFCLKTNFLSKIANQLIVLLIKMCKRLLNKHRNQTQCCATMTLTFDGNCQNIIQRKFVHFTNLLE